MVLRPEQFTEQAQEVLHNSQELVRRYHHSQWDVEHVLLALLELERGLPSDILSELGVPSDADGGHCFSMEAFYWKPPAMHQNYQVSPATGIFPCSSMNWWNNTAWYSKNGGR